MYKGTSCEQDHSFKRLREQQKEEISYPPIFSEKIDPTKINMEVIEAWISSKTTELLEIEDDILVGIIVEYLKSHGTSTEAKKLSSEIEPFLEEQTIPFIKELWEICQLAMKSEDGIPECLRRIIEQHEITEAKEEIREKIKQREHKEQIEYVDKRRYQRNRSHSRERHHYSNHSHHYEKEERYHSRRNRHKDYKDQRNQRDYKERDERRRKYS